jgi:hypothetical protein
MPFSEELKREVRRRAAYQCCRCHSTGVEVHHVVPQSEGGADDIDNAAPLCPSCHDLLGANPAKRKELREMRDWWYEVCGAKYPTEKAASDSSLSEINDTVHAILKGQNDLIPRLLSQLSSYVVSAGKWVSPAQAASLASGIVYSTTTGDASSLGSPFVGELCRRCGARGPLGSMINGLCTDCLRKAREGQGGP